MGVEFGRWLRETRRARGLRQGDLATHGLSVSYISMLESGSREPNAKVLKILANKFDIDFEGLSVWLPLAVVTEADQMRLVAAEFDLASGDAPRALAEFTALCESVGQRAMWGRARALEAVGDLEAALVAFEQVVASATQSHDPLMAARTLVAITRCHAETGDALAALRAGLKGRDILVAAGLEGSDEYAQTLSGIMRCYYDLGDIANADDVARRLLAMVDNGGSWKARASAYWNAAGVAEASGDLSQAVAYSSRALALLSEGDDERAWARCAQACAWFLMRLPSAADELDRVDRLLAEAGEKFTRSGTTLDFAYLETEQARSAVIRGDASKAMQLAQRALERLGTNARTETSETLLVLAEAQLASGDLDAARATADTLEMNLLSLPHSRPGAIVWRGLAEVHRRLGHQDAAYRALEHALNAHAIYAVDRDPARES